MRNVEGDVHFAKETRAHAHAHIHTHSAKNARAFGLFREIKERTAQQAVQRKSGRAIGETIYYGTLTASEAEGRYDIKLRRMIHNNGTKRDMTTSLRTERGRELSVCNDSARRVPRNSANPRGPWTRCRNNIPDVGSCHGGEVK